MLNRGLLLLILGGTAASYAMLRRQYGGPPAPAAAAGTPAAPSTIQTIDGLIAALPIDPMWASGIPDDWEARMRTVLAPGIAADRGRYMLLRSDLYVLREVIAQNYPQTPNRTGIYDIGDGRSVELIRTAGSLRVLPLTA